MDEKDIYKELTKLMSDKSKWEKSMDFVASLLGESSIKIKAKALWLLGEFGLKYPNEIKPYVGQIVNLLSDADSKIRERAVNALGRIGRADYQLIYPYWNNLMLLANDVDSNVRMNFIWACENIATNKADLYGHYMNVFVELLEDENERVRIEAPEIFRVVGKRIPEYVYPYIDKLKYISNNDSNEIVRIHASGAIKAILGK